MEVGDFEYSVEDFGEAKEDVATIEFSGDEVESEIDGSKESVRVQHDDGDMGVGSTIGREEGNAKCEEKLFQS